jgi:IS5 family transposase
MEEFLKEKNRHLDAFLSSLRMPFEGLFSKMSHRARYRGRLKVHFQALMEAMFSNFKRLIVIGAQPIPIY